MKIINFKVWGVKETLAEEVLKAVTIEGGIKVLFENNNVTYFEYKNCMYFMNDNGGEFNFSKINSFETHNVPYTKVNAYTIGYRITQTLRGEKIDWTFEVSEADNNSMLGVA